MWGLTKVSCQGSQGEPLRAWPSPLCSRAPGHGPKVPQGWLETELPGSAWAPEQGLFRRKGKGHTLGGQADGNSW